tara:strand:- start:1219 stop:1443 length:225 start_codon:yes stop_codon:yes gene_type:complete
MAKDKEVFLTGVENIIPANSITLHANHGAKEILRFTEDKLYLYGKEVAVEDPAVIEGFKNWMINNKYICDCEQV